eukprot:2172620-Rhodomonas_salina.1
MFWQNIVGICLQWLQNTSLKDFLVYEAYIARIVINYNFKATDETDLEKLCCKLSESLKEAQQRKRKEKAGDQFSIGGFCETPRLTGPGNHQIPYSKLNVN